MTLTETFIPYKRLSEQDAQIAAMIWEPEPEPYGMNQYPIFRDMFPTLDALIMRNRSPESTFINTNTFICYDPTDLNRRLAPDFYLAFGVDAQAIRDRLTYMPWEAGKAPDFVLEIASPTTARNDLTLKRGIYAQIGVTEYWRFDPTGGDLYGEALAGETLVEGTYERLHVTTQPDGHPKGFSPVLGLTLSWHDGDFRAYDEKTGEYVKSPVEQALYAEQQETVIEEQASVIEEQRRSLDAAESRIEQLHSELERLRRGNNGGSN